MKGCCELCFCTEGVNAFKIGLDGTVEEALRQKQFVTSLGHNQATESKSILNREV